MAFNVPSAFNIPVGSPILIFSLGSNGLTIDLRGDRGIRPVPGPSLDDIVSAGFKPSDGIVHEEGGDFFGTVSIFFVDTSQLTR